jgi:5-formyltetrahydrofolate cyclo-ligase
VCERLLKVPEVARARKVAAFAPTPVEVGIDPALRALVERGATLLLPWVDGDDLRLAEVADLGSDLAPGHRGVREPLAQRRIDVDPSEVDVAIVPGVAFDLRGTRLGGGGGHYDRFLVRLRSGTPVVAVAFAAQVVGALPREAHDVGVDVVVTERGVHRIRPA